MPCEPIYSDKKYTLIKFGRLLGLCQDRTQDGIAWEGELKLNEYRSIAWPIILAICLVVSIILWTVL